MANIRRDVPIYIYVGTEDTLSTVADALLLRRSIYGIRKFLILEDFTHGSFTKMTAENYYFFE